MFDALERTDCFQETGTKRVAVARPNSQLVTLPPDVIHARVTFELVIHTSQIGRQGDHWRSERGHFHATHPHALALKQQLDLPNVVCLVVDVLDHVRTLSSQVLPAHAINRYLQCTHAHARDLAVTRENLQQECDTAVAGPLATPHPLVHLSSAA